MIEVRPSSRSLVRQSAFAARRRLTSRRRLEGRSREQPLKTAPQRASRQGRCQPAPILRAGVELPGLSSDPAAAQTGDAGRRAGRRRCRQRCSGRRRSQRAGLASSPSAPERAAGGDRRRSSTQTTRRCRSQTALAETTQIRPLRRLSFATGREPVRRRAVLRRAQFSHHQFLRHATAVVQRRHVRPQRRLHVGRCAGRQQRRLGGARRAFAGRHFGVGDRRHVLQPRPGPASLRRRSFVRDAALRRRQSGGVA